MDVNECISQCLRGQRPDKPPDNFQFRIDNIVDEAGRLISEAEETRDWMLRNGFDPSNPSDVLLVISMLVTRRNEELEGVIA